MTLRFRNVDADPSDPVRTWPYEALVTALDRGSISDWRRIVREIRAHPWGSVARDVEAYLSYERPYGVAPLMEDAIRRARAVRAVQERQEVAEDIRGWVARSGLSRAEFASLVGTSESRLSTYCSGKVMPSAAMYLRMRRVPPEGR